jgi:hypothetical protein
MQVDRIIKSEANVAFSDMMALEYLFFVKYFHCAPPPGFIPSNSTRTDQFLCGGMEDDEVQYAKLREAAAEGPFGTCADGSERGKHSAKMQVRVGG